MKPIKVSELLETLEFSSEDFVPQVDLENGCVVMIDRSIVRALEEGDDETPDLYRNAADQSELKIAQAYLDDSGKRFLDVPQKFDFHEYRQMERFVGTVSDPAAAEQLWRAIKGKGAFRHFKDTAHRLGLLESWFQYRNEAMKQFCIDWAEAKQVPFVDDIVPRKPAQ